MKKLTILALAAAFTIAIVSCKKVFIKKDSSKDAEEVFEYLWKEIDQKYSFFDHKNIDWDQMKAKYKPQVYNGMSDEDLFQVLGKMVNELRDGHSNLISPFNVSNYYPIFLSAAQNFDGRLLQERYLRRNPDNYYVSGALSHTIIDTLGVKVGIIRYSSFSSAVDPKDIDYVINRLKDCDGIVFDIRSNGGGAEDNIFDIGSRFADQKRHVYSLFHKQGPAHNDFTKSSDIFIEPKGEIQFTKRIAVLINRGCFSASSFFSTAMTAFPHIRLVGDTTAGGMGIPNGGELPNGWSYRVSVEKTLAPDGKNYETGVPCQIYQNLDPVMAVQGYDSMVERAIQYIKTGN